MIPTSLIRALKTPPFEASAFTPTKFDTAEDKAWFGNHFFKFVANDFPLSSFTNRLYHRLSNSFGHIAHFNRYGFFESFFQDTRGKLDFLRQTMEWPCYGHPEYTFCDVERAIATRLEASQLLACYKARLAAEVRATELAILERLKTKYEPAGPPAPVAHVFRKTDLFDLSA